MAQITNRRPQAFVLKTFAAVLLVVFELHRCSAVPISTSAGPIHPSSEDSHPACRMIQQDWPALDEVKQYVCETKEQYKEVSGKTHCNNLLSNRTAEMMCDRDRARRQLELSFLVHSPGCFDKAFSMILARVISSRCLASFQFLQSMTFGVNGPLPGPNTWICDTYMEKEGNSDILVRIIQTKSRHVATVYCNKHLPKCASLQLPCL